jgi:hypothetical protein
MRTWWITAAVGAGGLAFGVIVLGLSGGGEPGRRDPEATSTGRAIPRDTIPLSTTATPTLWIDLGPSPGPDATPEPGATPDTRRNGWWIPYENVEESHPYFEGTLAGITIQTGQYVLPDVTCPNIRFVPVEEDYFSIQLGYNPPGMLRNPNHGAASIWCGDRLERAWAYFSYPPFTEQSTYGGPVDIVRYRGEAIAELQVREHRVEATTIGGHPAVIAAPYLDDFSRGEAAIVVWDGEYITKIETRNIRMAEVLRIAEGLFPPP